VEPPEQRGPGSVEHLVDRGFSPLGEPGHAEAPAAPEADSEPAAEVAPAAWAVDVLDPQLHTPDVLVEASERME